MKSMEAGQKTHSESQTMELNEVNGSWAEGTLGEPVDGTECSQAGQKANSESQTMELNEVNGSGAEGTLGEPDDGTE